MLSHVISKWKVIWNKYEERAMPARRKMENTAENKWLKRETSIHAETKRHTERGVVKDHMFINSPGFRCSMWRSYQALCRKHTGSSCAPGANHCSHRNFSRLTGCRCHTTISAHSTWSRPLSSLRGYITWLWRICGSSAVVQWQSSPAQWPSAVAVTTTPRLLWVVWGR